MRVDCLTHVPYEGPGALECALIRAGHAVERVRIYAGDPLPDPERVEGLLVMGGPMSIHDEDRHPWLVGEKRFLGRVVERGVPVLGICLGAQLIAHVLGARVYPNAQKEIGWFPVERSTSAPSPLDGLPQRFTAFHWHGETFDLPAGAVHLASSAACRNQAFAHGNALALQFHPEVLPSGVADLCRFSAEDLEPGPFVQEPAQMLGEPQRFAPIPAWCDRLVAALYGD